MKRMIHMVLGLGLCMLCVAGVSMAESSKGQMPGKAIQAKPGSQAVQTVEGKLKAIDGEFYVVEDPAGKEHRLHVSKDTLMVNGAKKPGDMLRADVTSGGHAISIQ